MREIADPRRHKDHYRALNERTSATMIALPSRDVAGTRVYRTTLALLVDDVADDLLVAAVDQAIAAAAPRERFVAAAATTHHTSWPELELQLWSSEADDCHDVDVVDGLQLSGERAAAYWTGPAATLLDTTAHAIGVVLEAVGDRQPFLYADGIILRTTPLGAPLIRPALSAAHTTPNAPTIQLAGIPPARGDDLATAVRDELDEQRWGPTETSLPSIRHDNAGRATITYPTIEDSLAVRPRIVDMLVDVSETLLHIQRVLDRIGAIGASAVEIRLDRPWTTPAANEA